MFNYIAAAIAALTISVAAPASAAVVQDPQPIAATCTPILNGTPGTPEACQVLVFHQDGAVGVGFAMASGTVLYIGVPQGEGVRVGAISVNSQETVAAQGVCAEQGSLLTCSATVTGDQGSATLTVKAAAR